MRERERGETAGIALVLVSGVTALLILVASAFAQFVHFQRCGNEGERGARYAELAAGSGLEYAAARLMERRADMTAPRTPEARADDWQYRGGGEYRREPGADFAEYPVPEALERTRSPSFSRGDPWIDDAADGIPGVRDEDEPFTDMDGDGRFSARSGRLRGGAGPFSVPFSLRIEPGPTCRINANWGERHLPWPGNNYGFGKGDRALEGSRNPEVALALNALGRVLDLGAVVQIPSPPHPGDYAYVTVSDLGNRILALRPPGDGYASLDALGRALTSGDDPLSEDEWRILEPHLTLTDDPDETPYLPGSPYPPEAGLKRLDLSGAPAATLHAFWTYRIGLARSLALRYEGGLGDLLAGSPPAAEFDFRSGVNFGPLVALFPDEVSAVVRALESARRSGNGLDGYQSVCRIVLDRMNGHGHAPGVALPSEQAMYRAKKADLMMHFTKADIVPADVIEWKPSFPAIPPPATRGTRGLDRDPAAPGDQYDSIAVWPGQFLFPETGQPYAGSEPYENTGGEPRYWPHKEFWLGPIRSFRAECVSRIAGRSGRRTGNLFVARPLVATTQEDFENLSWRRTSTVADLAPDFRPRRLDSGILVRGPGEFQGVQSLPGYSRKSYWRPATIQWTPYSTSSGALLPSEGESDFVNRPTIRWEFAPDSAFSTENLDGSDHAKGTGLYPACSPAQTGGLFVPGDPIDAHPGGRTTAFEIQDFLPSAGVHASGPSSPTLTYRFTSTDLANPLLPPPPPPAQAPVLPDAARMPAPLPMMPPDRILVPNCVPNPPLNNYPDFVYTPHPLQPRCFEQGGIEAWVTQCDGAGWRLATRGYQTRDSTFPAGDGPQEIEFRVVFDPVSQRHRYRLTSRYSIPARVYYSPSPIDAWVAESWSPAAPVIAGEWDLPVREGIPGPVYDHVLVEWRIMDVRKFTPIDPMHPGEDDVMPRMEVRLRVLVNNVAVTGNGTDDFDTHVTYSQWEPGSPGQTGSDHPMVTRYAFIPPWGRVRNGADSYLEFSMKYLDQVGLHTRFGAGAGRADYKDRFRLAGVYLSPVHEFPEPVSLSWAGWTGAMSEAVRQANPSALACRVRGYADVAGSQPLTPWIDITSADGPTADLDVRGVWSVRFRVDFDVPDVASVKDVSVGAGGTGACVDPPVFDDFSLLYTGRPRWAFDE